MKAGSFLFLLCLATTTALLVLMYRPDEDDPKVISDCVKTCRAEYGPGWTSVEVVSTGIMSFGCICKGPKKKRFVRINRRP